MRKTLLLLAAACCGLLLSAQTVPSVNFTFTIDAATSTVSFTNQSGNLGDGVKKAYWSFGDGIWAVTGAADGTHHRYVAAATYQACLKIYRYPTNSHDSVLVGSACKSLTIQQVCTAGFQWVDSLAGSSPTRVIRFYGLAQSTATNALKEVCWTFGDGTDTCIKMASTTTADRYFVLSHRYRESGVYNVCLRVVFDGGCVAEKCNPVTVPAVEPVKDSCSADFAVQSVTATSFGRRFVAKPWSSLHKKPQRICWKFGDGRDTCVEYTSSYTGDYWVEHRYAQNGRYEVCVSIRYDGGCESRTCKEVTIGSTTPPAVCEAGLNEVATNLASLERKFYVGLQANRRAEKICWKFGDGTDSCVVLSNPVSPQQLLVTHRYAAPGNYTVCIRVQYAEGCVAERCRPVEIRMPHSNICGGYMTDSLGDGNTVRFAATGIHGPNDEATGYLWSFGDGTSASGREVKHSFAAPGTYTVCVSIKTREGCETKICKPVTVAGNAQPQLTLAPNPVVNNLTAVFRSLVQQTVSVRIYNGTGILIRSYTRSAVVGANTWTFDLGGLQTGVYSMVVQSANQFATAIFFKQ